MADDNINKGKDQGRVRLTVDLSKDLNDTLEQLASSTGATKAELLRKGIALVEVALEARLKGNRLTISDPNDKVLTKIVGV
jgi:predicted DNA-binding protein